MTTSDMTDPMTDEAVNITPLHGEEGSIGFRSPPHNFEAEMGLLGAILVNNRSFERVQEFLLAEHFADPAHASVYAACAHLIEHGQIADPVTLKNYFKDDADLNAIGGQAYIAELANAVTTVQNAFDLGREVYDCFLRRELIDIGSQVVNSAYEYELETPAPEQIEHAEELLFQLAEEGSTETGFRDFKSAVTGAINMAAAAYKRDGQLVGVPTGFTDLDKLLGGLHESDLVIVAARPSMGKTALATNIAYHAASSKQVQDGPDDTDIEETESVAFFSLEMSAEQLATRIISEQAHVRSDSIRRGDVREEEYNRVFAVSQALHGLKIFIDDTPALTMAQIRTRSRRLKRQHGLSLIIVDYLQLINPPTNSRGDNRVQEVSQITRGLKALAKELNVPVIALSQLSRAVEQREDKRPQLSDLRESGSIEQDADVVTFIFREEYYREREKPTPRDSEKQETYLEREQRYMELMEKCRGKAEGIVAKQRHGPIGTEVLQFNG
ncbi:MAG TPA: replicative DNA helicase, partial [Rhodospirillaceae bacterium]|nr:replicative DNA helicase [Rhodospirillaceae bacterium]